MLSASGCIRLLQWCWRHFSLPNHHKHATKPCCLWMMPLSLPCMPCNPWFLHCKPWLGDLPSHKRCFSIFLFLQIDMPFLHDGRNGSMIHCFTLIKSFQFWLPFLSKVLKYDKTLKDKLKPKTTWPFQILRVPSNQTVIILLKPHVTKCINFWCTLSYQKPTPLQSYLEPCFSSLIMGRETIMLSCPYQESPGILFCRFLFHPCMVLCDIMDTCHSLTLSSFSCFVFVCVECLV